jgi:hypothetical protein
MKKIFVFIIFILVQNSCREQKLHKNLEFIDLLNKDIEIMNNAKALDSVVYFIPSSVMEPLFGKTESDYFVQTSAIKLNSIYNKFYKNEISNFRNFLDDFVNQKVRINKNKFTGNDDVFFLINVSVSKDYNKLSFSDFYNKFCLNKYNRVKIKSINFENDEFYTICYYLSLNNYFVSLDDFLGGYFVRNWSELTLQTK